MSFLREIGAFAGLAAFVGLAVLSFLYFAQARDVRRLRESASFLVEGEDGAEAPESGVPATATRPREKTATTAGRGAPPRGADKETFRRNELARQAAERRQRFERRRGGGRPRIGTSPTRGAGGAFSNRPEPRALAVIVVGAALLIAGVAFGASRILGGGDDSGGGGGTAPSQVDVAVLNSTAEPGLAGDVARELKAKGYDASPGNTSTPYDRSAVMFQTREFQPVAAEIARALKIQAVGPLQDDVRADAARADVTVVIGDDKAGA